MPTVLICYPYLLFIPYNSQIACFLGIQNGLNFFSNPLKLIKKGMPFDRQTDR